MSSSFESEGYPIASPRTRRPFTIHTATHLSKPPAYTIQFSQTVNTCCSLKKNFTLEMPFACLGHHLKTPGLEPQNATYFRNSFLMLHKKTMRPLKPHSNSVVAFARHFLHFNICSSISEQQISCNHHLQEPPYSFLAPSTASMGLPEKLCGVRSKELSRGGISL